MPLSGEELLNGLSDFLDDREESTTTGAGNSGGTTLVDSTRGKHGDRRLAGRYVRVTEGTTNLFDVRRVDTNTQATGTITVTPAFDAQVASGIDYQIHKYDPVKKFRALDKARLDNLDYVNQTVLDDTITSDGRARVYDIPAQLEQGPLLAFVEEPIACDVDWNFLTSPLLDATTGWTASSVTASTVERASNDFLIPKYDQECVKLAVAASTNGTYSQVVGSMRNDITAALSGGRKMTFAMWVYCTQGERVTLRIIDDTSTSISTRHKGGGWDLLWVERVIDPDNATTLTVRLDVASGTLPVTLYLNRGWFYFGDKERVVDSIFNMEQPFDARRDDAQNHVILGRVPLRGRQVRLQGRRPLSALGDDSLTQGSRLMEVDEKKAEILYAHAAEVLLRWEQITTDSLPDVSARIASVRARMPGLERTWAQPAPGPRIRSAFGF